jgi:hypothetical protein
MSRIPHSFIFLISTLLISPKVNAQLISTSGTYSDKKYDTQLRKGSLMVNLNGSASYISNPREKSLQYNVTPQIGYLIADRLAGGLHLSFGKDIYYQTGGATGTEKVPLHTFSQEVFLRYYITSLRVKPFIQATAGGNQYKSTNSAGREVKDYGFTGSGAVGLSFFISPKFSVEAMYNHRFLKDGLEYGNLKDRKVRIGISYFISR